jgi:hypothetical protein
MDDTPEPFPPLTTHGVAYSAGYKYQTRRDTVVQTAVKPLRDIRT